MLSTAWSALGFNMALIVNLPASQSGIRAWGGPARSCQHPQVGPLNPGVLAQLIRRAFGDHLTPMDDRVQKILGTNKTVIMRMARLEECMIGPAGDLRKCAVMPVRIGETSVDVIVPLDGLVDIDEEAAWQKFRRRIQQNNPARKATILTSQWLRIAATVLPVAAIAVTGYILFHSSAVLTSLPFCILRTSGKV